MDDTKTEGGEAVISKDAHPNAKFCTTCGADTMPESCNAGPCPHVKAFEEAGKSA